MSWSKIIRLECDADGCNTAIQFVVPSVQRARHEARHFGGWRYFLPRNADYCPEHRHLTEENQ
jgi:hypothetical protein